MAPTIGMSEAIHRCKFLKMESWLVCPYFFFYRQFIAHYVMSLLTAILSVAFIALPIVGIVWCSGEVSHYYVRINRVNYKKNVTCPDNKTAALVTGGLAAVDSFLICVWCILGTVFFCCFVRSYGFQNRGKRYLWCNIYYIHDIKQWTVQFNIFLNVFWMKHVVLETRI